MESRRRALAVILALMTVGAACTSVDDGDDALDSATIPELVTGVAVDYGPAPTTPTASCRPN